MGDVAAGAGIGIAQGGIFIDTSQLQSARDVVIQAARQMDNALIQLGRTADTKKKNTTSFFNTLNAGVTRNIQTIGLLAATTMAFGFTASNSLTRLNTIFVTMLGSQTKANKEMDALRKLADDTQQPFTQLLESSTAFVPVLKGSNVELARMVSLAQRLMMSDPTARTKDATIALIELMSGEVVSLRRRFEALAGDADMLKAAFEKGGREGAVAALDAALNKLNLTDAAVQRLGATGVTSFSVLRDEARQTLAEGFEPATRGINSMAAEFAGLLRHVRETNPELLRVLGTLTAIVGVTQAAGFASMIPGLNVPGAATLGKAGVLGAAAYGGSQLGVGLVRATNIGGMGNKSQGEVNAQVTETLKQMAYLIGYALAEFAKQIIDIAHSLETIWDSGKEAISGAIDDIKSALNDFLNGIVDLINRIPGVNVEQYGLSTGGEPKTAAPGAITHSPYGFQQPDQFQMGPFPGTGSPARTHEFGMARVDTFTEGLVKVQTALDRVNPPIEKTGDIVFKSVDKWDQATNKIDEFQVNFAGFLGLLDDGNEKVSGHVFARQPEQSIFSGEQVEAFIKFQDDMKQIEADYQTQREQQLAESEAARTQMEADYQQQLGDMADDEAVRRRRAEDQLSKQIAAVLTGRDETVAAENKSSEERLRAMRKEFRQTEKQRTEDHQRDMERMAEAHNLRMLEAAAHLDAKTIFFEEQSYALARSQREEDFQTETEQRRQQYEERLEQEKEAHEERLQTAEDAAEKQIAQLNENFAEQERLRAEDSARQLARMDRDHKQQMAAYDKEQQDRLAQLAQQAAAAKTARQNAFIEEFNSLTENESLKLGVHRYYEAVALAELQNWWEEMVSTVGGGILSTGGQEVIINGQKVITGRRTTGNTPVGAAGGTITRGGLIQAGSGEELLRQDTANFLRSWVGGPITMPALRSAVSSVGGRGNFNIGDIAIIMPDDAGQWNETRMKGFIRVELHDLLLEVANA